MGTCLLPVLDLITACSWSVSLLLHPCQSLSSCLYASKVLMVCMATPNEWGLSAVGAAGTSARAERAFQRTKKSLILIALTYREEKWGAAERHKDVIMRQPTLRVHWGTPHS